jgi:hypothetical protein
MLCAAELLYRLCCETAPSSDELDIDFCPEVDGFRQAAGG